MGIKIFAIHCFPFSAIPQAESPHQTKSRSFTARVDMRRKGAALFSSAAKLASIMSLSQKKVKTSRTTNDFALALAAL
jgi:hypothetical protein